MGLTPGGLFASGAVKVNDRKEKGREGKTHAYVVFESASDRESDWAS